jgi:hypothetical protein
LKCSDDLTKSRREMASDEPKPVRIQILAAKEEAGAAARAVAVARERMAEIADIARQQEAEALLVCPAPEEISEEGVDLVVYARFADTLDEDTVFWRQGSLCNEFHHALRLETLVLDLDTPRMDFLKHIEPLLAAPYRDEIGGRGDNARREI